MADQVIINCHPFDVLEERDGVLLVCRPNGAKRYRARRLPDSPLYGSNRAVMLPPAPARAGTGAREEG